MTAEATLAALQTMEAELNGFVFERRAVNRGILTALLAHEPEAPVPLVMIGKSGASKTMLAKAVCAAISADYFAWPMNPATLPDEIFGPIRSRLLLEEDRVERNPNGKLPARHVVLLDEFFYGGEAVLNQLLPVLAEGVWYNGEGAHALPLQLFLAGTNRIPDISGKEPLMSALWDRFVLRYPVHYLKERDNFMGMLAGVMNRRQAQNGYRLPMRTRLTLEQIGQARAAVRRVQVQHLFPHLWELRNALMKIGEEASDRKWGQLLSLVQVQAYLAGRDRAIPSDLAILAHALWTVPANAEAVAGLLRERIHPWRDHLQLRVLEAEDIIRQYRAAGVTAQNSRYAVECNGKLKQILRDLKTLGDEEVARAGAVPVEITQAMERVATYNREVVGSPVAAVR